MTISMGNLRGHRTVGIIVLFEALCCDVVICISRNIDKFEVSFHVLGHSFQVACELLADVFFEGRSFPPSHFFVFVYRSSLIGLVHLRPRS